MKKILSLLCASAMTLAVMSGCKDESENEKTYKEVDGMKIFTASEENVKPLGRTYFADDIRWCALSGTGVEFSVNATKAEVTIVGETFSEGNKARVAIYVDGERVVDDMLDATEKTYTVFESETAKNAVVSVVKLSETAMSTFGIKEIKVEADEAIAPTAQKERFIEFIGDSITCGYGVDDEDRDHHFATDTEDVTRAYAYKTAQALDADYSMVSISGYGIISGYSGDGKKHSDQTIPQYYNKLGFSYGSFGGTAVSSVEWDFTKRQPDLIVINLGTNDDSYCGSDAERQDDYTQNYIEFIKQIRASNPDAKILCTFGIMGDRLFRYVNLAVETYSAETGDTNISAMAFTPQLAEDGWVADWHPTEATHTKASDKLVAEIKTLMNW